ncbi:MAG: cobalamin biosynthesis protein, partial [Pseudomonadota bacterium]
MNESAEHRLTVTHTETEPKAGELVYYRADTVLGVGCERGAEPEELIALAKDALRAANISHHSLACVASINVKADEAAVHAVAAHFGVPSRFFTAEQLEAETPRLATPSDIVFAEVGCHGVCEGAALAAGGASADLVLAKQKSKRATVAIARSDDVIDPLGCGRARGHSAPS